MFFVFMEFEVRGRRRRRKVFMVRDMRERRFTERRVYWLGGSRLGPDENAERDVRG